RHGWSGFPKGCAAEKTDGNIRASTMRMELDAVLREPTVAGVVGRDHLGGSPLAAAAVPLHHLPQCWGSVHGPAHQLVAGSTRDRVAQDAEVRPGVRRQSRKRRQPRAAL